MKTTITIIVDCDVPVSQLLNSQDFEIIKTEKDDVFTMIKKEVVKKSDIIENWKKNGMDNTSFKDANE